MQNGLDGSTLPQNWIYPSIFMLFDVFFIFFISFLLICLDGRIGKDDLRVKLMQKSASRMAESNGNKRHVDLREKLSKTAHHSPNSFTSKQRMPEPRETSLFRSVPSARSSDDLMRVESMRSNYTPWTLDQIRKRSPDGFPSTSRAISPQRNVGDLQRRPLNRTYDGVRPLTYVGRDVLDASRPPNAAPSSFMSRSTVSTLPPVTAKPVTSHPVQLPPSSSVAQRAPFVVNFTYTLISICVKICTNFSINSSLLFTQFKFFFLSNLCLYYTFWSCYINFYFLTILWNLYQHYDYLSTFRTSEVYVNCFYSYYQSLWFGLGSLWCIDEDEFSVLFAYGV